MTNSLIKLFHHDDYHRDFMTILFILNYTLKLSVTKLFWFCNCAPPWVFTPLDILFEYWIEHVFIIIVQFMMSANIRIRFGLQIVLVCLYSAPYHYHHCANLSEGIELIKCLSDIFCRVRE